MDPYWGERFGNPHSRDHAIGWRAAEALDAARQILAKAVGAFPDEIIFTSGATEANALALSGTGRNVAVSAIEHPSVLNTQGVHLLPIGSDGLLDADIPVPRDAVLSVALVNHELGTIQPIGEIAKRVHEGGGLIHTDCAQALGKVPLDLHALDVDLASLSAHKAYGPVGIGALFMRRGLTIRPLFAGGAQEMGLRPGTVALPLAVGFAEAACLAADDLEVDTRRIVQLRDRLMENLQAGIPGLEINGTRQNRVAGNLNITVPDVLAEDLMLAVPDLALSSGSACASGDASPSTVLSAIGLSPETSARTLRICLGRFTTADEIETSAHLIVTAWKTLQEADSR